MLAVGPRGVKQRRILKYKVPAKEWIPSDELVQYTGFFNSLAFLGNDLYNRCHLRFFFSTLAIKPLNI